MTNDSIGTPPRTLSGKCLVLSERTFFRRFQLPSVNQSRMLHSCNLGTGKLIRPSIRTQVYAHRLSIDCTLPASTVASILLCVLKRDSANAMRSLWIPVEL